MPKKLIGILLSLLPLLTAHAQKFEYGVDYTYFFDNLEYGDGSRNTGFDKAMTIHAMRLTPELGLSFASGDKVSHRLMAGVDIMKEMGSGVENCDILQETTAWYSIDAGFRNGSGLTAVAGIFPRTFSKAPFNPLFYDESVLFFDNNFEGMLFRYEKKNLYADVSLDWNGQYGGGGDPGRHERFMVLSYGRWNFSGNLDLEWTARFDHFAGSPDMRGVVDNDLVSPMLAWSPGGSMMDVIDISAGGAFIYQYDRRAGELATAGGFVTRQRLEKCHVGVDNIFYAGMDLMPFYDKYGSDLYKAEECYHTKTDAASWCDQLHLYYSPHIADRLSLTLAFAFHLGSSVEGAPVFRGWQQMLSLKVDL